MSGKNVVLSGTVTEVSRPGLYIRSLSIDGFPQDEQVTFFIEGAMPLWAELRIPNNNGWMVGDRVAISIVSVEQQEVQRAA